MTHSIPEEHRKETFKKIKTVSKDAIAQWLLEHGYYAEQYVLPPCFKMDSFALKPARYKEHDKLSQKALAKVGFPKTDLTDREFSLMHPFFYHDLVWEFHKNWDEVMEHLFNDENIIYSYSFPVPPTKLKESLKPLRSGRMIYEFLELAEKDLVAEAHRFEYILRMDITNFYPSIYTHTICWAWEGRKDNKGRDKCLGNDAKGTLFGNRLDKLFQYSNDRRTVGLPVGPVISDLVSELILSERDLKASRLFKEEGLEGKFLATRFKDDYRILCADMSVAKRICRIIINVLKEFNFVVNEQKTKTIQLPDGLYRPHAVEYETYSLRKERNLDQGKVAFKQFEYTLLKVLAIHKAYPGTYLIEKFLSELIKTRCERVDGKGKINSIEERLLLSFGDSSNKSKDKKIKKTVSLLFMLKNESSKSLGKVLAIFEHILLFGNETWFRDYIKVQIIAELKQAIKKRSAFELNWLFYFSCRHQLNIDLKRVYTDLRKEEKNICLMSKSEVFQNPFVATLRGKVPGKAGEVTSPFFEKLDELDNIELFTKPADLSNLYLIEYLDIFDRSEIEER